MGQPDVIPQETELVAKAIVDSAFQIHSALGPGLLESVYEGCMFHDLSKKGFELERQMAVPVRYDGLTFKTDFRLDLCVNRQIIVEIKAVEQTLPVHKAQLLTYLRLTGMRLGLLINFNVPLIRDGIRRIVN